ncbi:MAG: hypothetical protein MNPFHGCM_01770 [Gemmatimonadaceae bacterium]|nr:hypothetical protein [Gemmatimonadaceae bacterium]
MSAATDWYAESTAFRQDYRMTTAHRLSVWRKADLLAKRLCSALPCDERYGHSDLVQRLREVAIAIPLAIDSGSRAEHAESFAEEIGRAIRSTHELVYRLAVLEAVGSLASTEAARLLARSDQVERMLVGLLRTVESRLGRGRLRSDTRDRPGTLRTRRLPAPLPSARDG